MNNSSENTSAINSNETGLALTAMRIDFTDGTLSEEQLASDPISQFIVCFNEAVDRPVSEANAMTLSTVGRNLRPSARVVLLKEVDRRGFVFCTNYDSDKGRELAENPQATLLFFWKELQRQVRISGLVEKISPEESDVYFYERPVESRIGALASAQSRVIGSRSELESRFAEIQATTPDPQRPAHWGGYRLLPDEVEFWQGRPSRLHDRLRYRLVENMWVVERLSP